MHRFSLVVVVAAAALLGSGCTQHEGAPSRSVPAITPSQPREATPGVVASIESSVQTLAIADWTPEPTRIPAIVATDGSPDLLGLISVIDTTVTLGAWKKAHPVDSLVTIAVTGVDHDLCRTAIANVKVGSETMLRSAVFDISAPPPGERLPADSLEAFDQFCTLRAIWISAYFPDSASAGTFADSLRRVIGSRLGTPKPKPSLPTYEADQAVGNTWQNQGTTVVLAVQPALKGAVDRPPATDTTQQPKGNRLLLVSYTSGSALQDDNTFMARLDAEDDRDAQFAYADADSAITWANVPAIASDLRFVIGQLRTERLSHEGKRKRDPRVEPALLRAVKATHDIAPSLPPDRRAAALFATDVVLFAAMPFVPTDTTKPVNRALSAVGITFDNLPIDNLLQNTRPWLWEAYHVDSLGRGGHAAFLELLSLGWSTRGACNGGGSDHEKIIEHGETALKNGDRDPLVHYYVASAYKTIWDSAHMPDANELVDPKPYRPRAAAARLRAIEHYRTALAGMPSGPQRRLAWVEAVKLILGGSEQPEHICFYD